MRDVLDAIEGWRAEGHRVALATVTKVKGCLLYTSDAADE